MVRRDHSPRRSTAGGDVLAYAEAADAAALAAPDDAEVFTKLAVPRVSGRRGRSSTGGPLRRDRRRLFAIAARAESDCGISFD